jgi:hypothetical protein
LEARLALIHPFVLQFIIARSSQPSPVARLAFLETREPRSCAGKGLAMIEK